MSIPVQLDPESLERFRGLLNMLARAQVGPKYRAKIDPEEIVNQTLFDVHRQRLQFRGCSDEELVAWLRKVLDNNVKDVLKFLHRDKRDLDRENVDAHSDWSGAWDRFLDVTCGWTSPSMHLIKQEWELQLANALAQLPQPQRDAVELHHLHGCTLAATAEQLGRTVPAVIGLLRRGLKRLREILQQPTTGNR